MTITWNIEPVNTPAVIKNCSHCGCGSKFVCSNNFRINAQQKKIDVWLIYKCKKCGCTWNMDIYSRVKPEDLEGSLYNGFLKNSMELAFRYAFDAGTLAKNKAKVSYEDVQYNIEGENIDIEKLKENPVTLKIANKYNLQIRLDKILCEKLKISRSTLRLFFESGAVRIGDTVKKPENCKLKIKGDAAIEFNSEIIRSLSENQIEVDGRTVV